jgi:hypothetical protein
MLLFGGWDAALKWSCGDRAAGSLDAYVSEPAGRFPS